MYGNLDGSIFKIVSIAYGQTPYSIRIFSPEMDRWKSEIRVTIRRNIGRSIWQNGWVGSRGRSELHLNITPIWTITHCLCCVIIIIVIIVQDIREGESEFHHNMLEKTDVRRVRLRNNQGIIRSRHRSRTRNDVIDLKFWNLPSASWRYNSVSLLFGHADPVPGTSN